VIIKEKIVMNRHHTHQQTLLEGQSMKGTEIIYKIWLPGEAPTTHKHTLTLENIQALRFFVEALACGARLFANKPLAMCAYHIVNELVEREIAHGTYQIRPGEDGSVELYTLYESGVLEPGTGCGVISAAITSVCMQLALEQANCDIATGIAKDFQV
jgi:hypothetical protein